MTCQFRSSIQHETLQGVLIAVVQYQRITGLLRLTQSQCIRHPRLSRGTTFTYWHFRSEPYGLYRVISNRPIKIVSYGSEIVPCNSQFSGNISSSFNCAASTPSAHTRLKGLSMCLMSSVVLVMTIIIYT